jgi:cytochrome-b5 reductase
VAAATAYFFLGRKRKAPVALHTDRKITCTLLQKEIISHDTRRFRFALPSPDQVLGLPIGKHIMISARLNDKLEVRAYTPVTSDIDVGYFDLVIKVYFKGVHPKFPDGGKITQYLESLSIGDAIEVAGPKGTITYEGHGNLRVEDRKNKKNPPQMRHASVLGMIAGGSGITPMYQIAKHILSDPTDNTQMYLLYANQTEEDILLRKELEAFSKDPRFHLWYTLDRPSQTWEYSSGFINEEMLRSHFVPGYSDDTQILMCGPPPMLNYACIPNLEKIGFTSAHWLDF